MNTMKLILTVLKAKLNNKEKKSNIIQFPQPENDWPPKDPISMAA